MSVQEEGGSVQEEGGSVYEEGGSVHEEGGSVQEEGGHSAVDQSLHLHVNTYKCHSTHSRINKQCASHLQILIQVLRFVSLST